MRNSILNRLGITPAINGKGTSTRLGGANLRPEVLAAMAEAATVSIDAFDLQCAASRAIAKATGAEAGMVTTGASAALLLASAACLARLDVRRMNLLPEDPGPRRTILVPKSHRNFYDRALLLPGARLKEVGVSDRVTGAGVRDVEAWEIEGEIDGTTAAIFYVATARARPSLAEVGAIARRHGVPLIVDAAGQLPPLENLGRFLDLGADLVAFSGGKAIQGPPGTGILCGRRDLIASAVLQSIDTDIDFAYWRTDGTLIGPGEIPGLPRHGVGRSCKVGKEEVVGLLAALDLFAAEGVASDTARWTSLARRLSARLNAVDGLDATFVADSYRPGIPGVRLRFAADPVRRAAALTRFLRDRDPPVFLDQERLDDGDLGITTICLRDEDVDAIVAAVSDFAGGAATDRG